MKKDRKILALYLVMAFMFLGCSSQMTIAKFNKPAFKNFKENLKEVKATNKIYGDTIVKRAVEDERYYFDRKIKIRNKIIDSLGLLKKKKLLIVDSSTDSNGKRVELSYFFYDDKINFVWFSSKDSISNGEVFTKYVPKIENMTREHLEKTNRDILLIYNTISGRNPPSVLNSGSDRTSYLVTKVSDNIVSYYSVSGERNYKVVNFK